MIKHIVLFFILFVAVYLPWTDHQKPVATTSFVLADFNKVADLEQALGKNLDAKKPNFNLKNVSVEAGESLVKNGFAVKGNGKKTKTQSKHFVCTSCHNIEREDPNLAVNDPQARLVYTTEKGLPYLQGTALYGAVNRSQYYNGDYFKKYGDLVFKAKDNIREAIQLCAQECAQGRKLADWELESILAYLWTIGLETSDLQLTDADKAVVDKALQNQTGQKEALMVVDSKYLTYSAATFVYPPENRHDGNGLTGDKANGGLLYEKSCLHCHEDGRYSYLDLDMSKMSMNYLKRNVGTYHRQSVYQVVRWGVPVRNGKKSYMPQYPIEKMSEQQLADLVAFIND